MAETENPSQAVRLSVMQRQAGKFLAACQGETVQVTVFAEVDVRNLMATRAAMANGGAPPSITHFLIGAVASALRRHPRFNAHYQDGSLRLFDTVDIGLAVALERGDLITPVLRGVHDMTLAGISSAATDLVARARNATLKVDDMRGAGFTLSSMGRSGAVKFATPVIPVPQVAILAATQVREAPVVEDGAIRVAPILPLSLSFDHRAVNGAQASAFVQTLADALAWPETLRTPIQQGETPDA